MGWKHAVTSLKIGYANPVGSAKPGDYYGPERSPLWFRSLRLDCQSQITNHFSRLHGPHKRPSGSGFEMIRVSQCRVTHRLSHTIGLEKANQNFVTWDLSFGHKNPPFFLQLSCKRGVSRAYNWYEVICSNQQETRATFRCRVRCFGRLCFWWGSRGSPALCANRLNWRGPSSAIRGLSFSKVDVLSSKIAGACSRDYICLARTRSEGVLALHCGRLEVRNLEKM